MGRSRLFLIIGAFFVGLGLFKVKYQVMSLEKRHKDVVKSVAESRESIHVLKAELTHLNDPERLQKLAENHLGFSPVKPHQIVAIDDLPRKTQPTREASVDPVDEMMNFLDNDSGANLDSKKASLAKNERKVALNAAA